MEEKLLLVDDMVKSSKNIPYELSCFDKKTEDNKKVRIWG